MIHRLIHSAILPVCLIGAIGLTSSSTAADVLEGPVTATVERVVDGDTLAVRAQVWIGPDIDVLVRLRRIDAPELRGDCSGEIALARDATAALAAIVDSGPVTLLRIEGDKYFGRVVADVSIAQEDVSRMLIETGLVRSYHGGTRAPWCEAGVLAGDKPGRSLR